MSYKQSAVIDSSRKSEYNERVMDILKKAAKTVGIVLGVIVGLVLILYATMWIVRGAAYGESRSLRRYVCKIPGLGSGFCPQGVAYSAEYGLYVLTGYEKGNNTVVYIVKDDEATRINVTDADGELLKGHGGGVACAGEFVYIANDSRLVYFHIQSFIDAGGKAVAPNGVKPTDNKASYCFSDGKNMYVGEFYRPGNYETDERHHYKTPNGDENKAIVSCYALDEHGVIAGDYPEYAISVTDLVQGFAVSGDKYMLSRSYGLAHSSLEYYSGLKRDGDATVTVSFEKAEELGSTVVPLYYLDGTNLYKSLTLPAFAEDLDVVDGRVIVTNESACNSYIVGKLFPGADVVYSYPIINN